MSKYKVGDRVVVISKEEAEKKRCVEPGFVDDMKKYCGKTVTIKDVKKICCGSTHYYIEEAEWVWSDEFFEGLTGEQQEIIREAAETAKEYAREQSDERIASRIQTIEESGTQIISLSDEMYEQIRELCKPVYESIEKNVSEDLVDAYLGDIKGVIE